MQDKNIWIVSWYDYSEPSVVTAFNNKDAAMQYYAYELSRDHEKVDIDECPIYSTFTETEC